MRYQWAWRLLAATAVVGALTGCAQEREPINRVQAMALKKSFFVGDNLSDPSDDPEFYTQQFITDVPYGAGQGLFTVGYGGNMTRVKFEITEQYLIARIDYERIDNTDGKGKDPHLRNGMVAAMFPITAHFDIRRSYNPQTGEQMNVIEENATDRPWYERDYFRVDWSKNVSTDTYDFDSLTQMGFYGGFTYEPMAYQVDDPANPDAPHFSTDDGYFDITTKAFATPAEIDISSLGWGIDKVPACWVPQDFYNGSAPSGSCNPAEITVRLSFLKVKDHDYEPANWDGYRFQAYGAFYSERYGYCDNYGMCDNKWRRFINRYQIWNRTHYYDDPVAMTGSVACNTEQTTPLNSDPTRDEDHNGTADECEKVTQLIGVAGSQCDVFKNKCTLPYRARQAITVPWYFTNSDPAINAEYFQPTDQASNDWDVALRAAVQSARYAECTRTGGTDCATQFPMYTGQQTDNEDATELGREMDMCRRANGWTPEAETTCGTRIDQMAAARSITDPGVVAIAKAPEVITLCHSPVVDDDSPACGARGTIARIGDLRYHQINTLTPPATESPWGIEVDSVDPLSGENIMASVNCFAFVNDWWSQRVVDYARYIKGELTTEDITEGQNVREWAQAEQLASSSGGIIPALKDDDLDKLVAASAGVEPSLAKSMRTNPLKYKGLLTQVKAMERQLQKDDLRASAEAVSPQQAVVKARLTHAHDSEFEAQLISPELMDRAGYKGSALSADILNAVSPLRTNNPQFEADWHRLRENALAARGVCVMDEAPEGTGVAGLTDLLYKKFPPADAESAQQTFDRVERMRNYLARRVQYAVILHEMGHSVGLRHNFVSSYDAFSFRPQYWQLRTKDGTVTQPCTQLSADGESCVGPRYYDPITPEENDQVITMFMQDSVMDYAGTVEGDLIGLGKWDYAAARMFYGDTTAVFADEDMKADQPKGYGMLDKMDNFGGITGIQPKIRGNDPIFGDGMVGYHYSQYQNQLGMIHDCAPVDVNAFKPTDWDDAKNGPWDPLLDGRVINVNGQYTRCQERKVDYVSWKDLNMPDATTQSFLGFYRGGPAVDNQKRVRIPYGFATDDWADLGNLSVYRHDLGADPYELFQFFITQQETRHIWDDYRRGMQSFSVRASSNRAFERYNTKMRDAVKGLGLYANLYRGLAVNSNPPMDYNSLWAAVLTWDFRDNILASGLAFDHFARTLSRPEDGDHWLDSTRNVFVSANDASSFAPQIKVSVRIPNGATGYFKDVGIGGKPVENGLAQDQGEYDRDYTINAGSYYDKINAGILLAESVDNFISETRNDFVDPRYRSVSVADVFPVGYNRLVANMLTGDEWLKGPRVAANASGKPLTEVQSGYPTRPMGWTSWWPTSGPEVCFPGNGSYMCDDFIGTPGLNPDLPANTANIDPEVGWEQQKQLIAQTLLYLPEDQKQQWLDQMRIYELGPDTDPGFTNRIEFHNPVTGKVYVARTYGTESLFGKPGYQKGIGARVLQYANSLVSLGFKLQTDPDKVAPDLDGDLQPDWPLVVYNPDGTPVIIPKAGGIDPSTGYGTSVPAVCDQNLDKSCTPATCEQNPSCVRMQNYIELVFFMRQAITAYGLEDLSERGVY